MALFAFQNTIPNIVLKFETCSEIFQKRCWGPLVFRAPINPLPHLHHPPPPISPPDTKNISLSPPHISSPIFFLKFETCSEIPEECFGIQHVSLVLRNPINPLPHLPHPSPLISPPVTKNTSLPPPPPHPFSDLETCLEKFKPYLENLETCFEMYPPLVS